MEMRYSREFVALAETGNFMKAAENLFMAQSTLSRHIQVLEQDLGYELLVRSTRKTELTEIGRLYYQYAKRIVEIEDDCMSAISQHVNGTSGCITCGMIPLAAKYGFRAITALHISHPKYKIKTVLNDSATLKEMLLNGQCDFCLARELDASCTDEFHRIEFIKDSMQLVVSPTHPLASSPSVSLAQFSDETFLFAPEGTENYADCVSACRAAGFTPHIGGTITPVETIIDMVEMGLGVTLLPKIRTGSIASKVVKIIDIDPPVNVCINLLYLKSRKLTAADKAVLAYLTQKDTLLS